MKDSNLPETLDTLSSKNSDDEKYSEFLTEDVIKAYCGQFSVGRDEAKARLVEGFKNEELIDPRHVALKAMKGIRLLSPKVAGLNNRIKDCVYHVDSMRTKVSSFEGKMLDIEKQLIKQREAFKAAIRILEESAAPTGFWNKIKWLLKR